jgi:hypothetical protein
MNTETLQTGFLESSLLTQHELFHEELASIVEQLRKLNKLKLRELFLFR